MADSLSSLLAEPLRIAQAMRRRNPTWGAHAKWAPVWVAWAQQTSQPLLTFVRRV